MPDPSNDRLFRYLSLATSERQQWARNIFAKHELFFPSPKTFNDPFDCKVPALEALPKRQREEFIGNFVRLNLPTASRSEKRRVGKKLSTKSAFAKTTESLQSNVDASGVLCLSECHDDILIWSHYADSHRGICLEFKATNTALFGEAQRVEYAETYTNFPLLGRDTEQIQRVLLTKSSHWKYEKEWRTIRRSQIVNGLPQYIGSRLCSFSPGDLRGVIFGCQCSRETMSMVRAWIAEGDCECSCYRARQKIREYGLEIIPM
jgi:hypothetical protein